MGPLLPFQSGLYDINGTSTSNPGVTFDLAGSLMQNGSSASVSGILHFTSSSCFPFSTDISVSGMLTETDFSMVASLPSGQKLAFSNLIHPGSHPQFLAGTYSVSGPGCVAADQGNTSFGAQGVTAHWVGTFTSSTSATATIAMSLTQTGPDAHGFFSATGTATITGGGTCFSSAMADPTTLILGKGSTLVLDNSAAGTTGQTVLSGDFFPASPVGAGFFNGTYTSTQGACSETGTVSLQMG